MSTMPTVQSNLSPSQQLEKLALQIRREIIQMLAVAGSGHLASPLGLADFMAFFYSYILRHNPHQPADPHRDRFFLSSGHVCPVLYATLAKFDYFPPSELFTLRQLGSRLQGHPHRQPEIGLENTSGPLGQGVSQAVGHALILQRDAWSNSTPIPHVYVLSSDGEQQEGQVWEAYQLAAQNNLNNFTIIIDVNDIQISGRTSQVMNQRDLAAKLETFGFASFKVDGHNFHELASAFTARKKVNDRPGAIIMDTTPGKGVSFMENDYQWHSHDLNREQVQAALTELGIKDIEDKNLLEPEFINWWRKQASSLPKEIKKDKATRQGFGDCLTQLAPHHPELMVLSADLSASLHLTSYKEKYPTQYLEIGVAEQNMASVAAGIAMQDKTVFCTSFATFNPGRNWEQIRVGTCLQNLNVKIVGSHSGLSAGADGATHQALEDIALMRVLPEMTIIVPCDYHETQQAVTTLVKQHFGPAYLRLSREPSPMLTEPDDDFKIGQAKIMHPGKDGTIITCGRLVAVALEAAAQLQTSHQLNLRIINMHTIKPLDTESLCAAVQETKYLITFEEHQIIGGLGSACADWLSQNYATPLKILGINDTFGESGSASELLVKYNLTVDQLKKTVLDLESLTS